MKTLGIIGGMSWESTAYYYRIINEAVKKDLGGLHSAKLILYSVDFALIEGFMCQGKWDHIADELSAIARLLARAGADYFIIATNTMHKTAAAVEKAAQIPLLHIADPTAEAISCSALKRVGLIGTRMTMEDGFYQGRLQEKCPAEVIVPVEKDRIELHRIIFEELCLGRVLEHSRQKAQKMIGALKEQGAEGVILGCTELTMLIAQKHSSLPLFDTTELHALKAAAMLTKS